MPMPTSTCQKMLCDSAREGLRSAISRVHRWYEHQKNDEHLRRIRNHAALIAFEQELMQLENRR